MRSRLAAAELAERERLAREAASRPVHVRELAREWLAWQRDVKQIKPSTLRDYERAAARAGRAVQARGSAHDARPDHRRPRRPPIESVRTRDVSAFLRSLDAEGLTAAQRQQAPPGARRDVPVRVPRGRARRCRPIRSSAPTSAPSRRRPRSTTTRRTRSRSSRDVDCGGAHRRRERDELDRRTDEQDAELFRVLFLTGLRLGEALTLRWDDVDLELRTILVRRGLSADVEGIPKGRRFRIVPLAEPAVASLERLRRRGEFIGADDYVFANVWGRRLDGSAVRRRYKAACAAAGLRPLRLHALRHAAGSIVARTADPVFVRDMLGHAKLTTTDRYVSAKLRPEEYARLDAAFTPAPAVEASA